MRNISDGFVKKTKEYILQAIVFFFAENRAVYGIMWKNATQPDRPQMTT
jgi:hypothetical protein